MTRINPIVPMNPEVKELWLNAMRSGDYNKGEGVLFSREGGKECHCGLGVLMEEAAKVGLVEINPEGNSLNRYFERVPESRLIPNEVAEWAGFGDYYEGENQVAHVNDARVREPNFDRVIEWVEENL